MSKQLGYSYFFNTFYPWVKTDHKYKTIPKQEINTRFTLSPKDGTNEKRPKFSTKLLKAKALSCLMILDPPLSKLDKIDRILTYGRTGQIDS